MASLHSGKMRGASSRRCTRCGRSLDDPVSVETGVGPVCRSLDNALLARRMPADVPRARNLLSEVDEAALDPESRAAFEDVLADLESKNKDHRLTVRDIEWILSFDKNRPFREIFADAVRALGYPGLPALWEGEASTGKASIDFLDGRLYVTGPKNRAAREAFRAISGWRFHEKGPQDSPAWSFPAAESEKVETAVCTFYPNHEGLEEAMEAAELGEELGEELPSGSAAGEIVPFAAFRPPESVSRRESVSSLSRLPPGHRTTAALSSFTRTVPPGSNSPGGESFSARPNSGLRVSYSMRPGASQQPAAVVRRTIPAERGASPGYISRAATATALSENFGPNSGRRLGEKPADTRTNFPSFVRHGNIITLRVPYNEAFVAELKRRVPWEDRVWNPDTRIWEVSAAHHAAIADMMQRYFGLRETV